MPHYQITLPFYKRLFQSLENPKNFFWKAKRGSKFLCRQAYSSAVAPFSSRRSIESVALLHLGRCGSTVLGDLLDQHSSIFWDGEIYSKEYRKCFYSQQKDAVFDPFIIFERHRHRCGKSYYGFESKTSDRCFMNCSVDDFIKGLSKRNVNKFILLRRCNLLRIAASFQLAVKKRSFHVWKHEKPQLHKIQLLEIDKGMGIKMPLIEQLLLWTADLQKLKVALKGFDVLELSYEKDIQTDPLAAMHKVTDFLQLPPVSDPIINLNTTTPFPLRDFVEDLDQVIEALRGTPYEHLVDTM